jgi:hypothetical protein
MLFVVARYAQRPQIIRIHHAPAVFYRDDMIHDLARGNDALLLTLLAQWMLPAKPRPELLPSHRIVKLMTRGA